MTEKDEKLLAEFEHKMRQLMFRCDSFREENELLKQQINSKDEKINTLLSQVSELESKYNNLKFAKSFSTNESEETQKAKARLSKLVRDVDKCIALLKG